jgi:hypothetical protein
MDGPIQMPTPVDEDVVQAFRADGLHEPLGEGVGLRRSDGVRMARSSRVVT